MDAKGSPRNNVARTLVSAWAMRKKIVHPVRSALCVAGLTLAFLGNDGARAGEDLAASPIVCAQREVLLLILVEAHGAAPNPASDKLAAEGAGLMQARIACDNGEARQAIMFYNRLIAELTAALTPLGRIVKQAR